MINAAAQRIGDEAAKALSARLGMVVPAYIVR